MAQKAAEILSLLRSDHKKAFKSLYREYKGMIDYLVKKNNGNQQDADDVFQDSLLALYQQSLELNFTINCQIKTYLYSIARNLWLKELRNRKKKLKINDYEKHVTINMAELEEEKEDNRSALVQQAMKQLGEKCQQILQSFYFLNKKMDVIAQELGYTNAANVKNQKYKCMQKLKQLTLAAQQHG